MRLTILCFAVACAGEAAPPSPEASPAPSEARPRAASEPLNPRLLRRFRPVRAELGQPDNQELVALGRMLYFETRLSASHEVSCNTCHPLERYGTDGEPTSRGHQARRGTRNAPSTYHAAGLVAQFWDGRAPDVEHQAISPMLDRREMASTEQRVIATLRSMPEYGERFARAFPDDRAPVSLANVGKAIGAFERGLVTPARWDRYLAGDKAALTDREIDGLRVFTNSGCMTCHTGEFLGGTSFQQVGVAEAWPNPTDRGRIAITGQPSDDMVFRVSSLRNVARTAPYFHDASASTLDQAVKMMARHQLGLELSADDTAAIIAWLGSLTGELPAAYIAKPTLPPSTASTPPRTLD